MRTSRCLPDRSVLGPLNLLWAQAYQPVHLWPTFDSHQNQASQTGFGQSTVVLVACIGSKSAARRQTERVNELG